MYMVRFWVRFGHMLGGFGAIWGILWRVWGLLFGVGARGYLWWSIGHDLVGVRGYSSGLWGLWVLGMPQIRARSLPGGGLLVPSWAVGSGGPWPVLVLAG